MPFGMVSGVGGGMGILDRCGDRRREGAVWGRDAALPKLLWAGLDLISVCVDMQQVA